MLQLRYNYKDKNTEIENYFKEFYKLYRSEIQTLHDKIYNEEIVLDKSNKNVSLYQYYLAFEYVLLIYLDYRRNEQSAKSYYVNIYEVEKYRYRFKCNGINIDKIFAIFGLDFKSISSTGISSTIISETFVLGDTIDNTVIELQSNILDIIDNGTFCINKFKHEDCQVIVKPKPVVIGIKYYEGLECGSIILSNNQYIYYKGDTIEYSFTIRNNSNVDITTEYTINKGNGESIVKSITIPANDGIGISDSIVNIKGNIIIRYNLGVQCTRSLKIELGNINDLAPIIYATQPICNYINSHDETTILGSIQIGTLITDTTYELWKDGIKLDKQLINGRYSGLVEGTYVVISINKNGTLSSNEVTIVQPDELIINTPEVEGTSEIDVDDGEIRITSTGGKGLPHYYRIVDIGINGKGIPIYPYTATIGTSNGSQSSILFTGLKATTYAIRVYNDDSCQSCFKQVSVKVDLATQTKLWLLEDEEGFTGGFVLTEESEKIKYY